MIIWRNWCEGRTVCEGWFLCGLIPIYIRKRNVDVPSVRSQDV